MALSQAFFRAQSQYEGKYPAGLVVPDNNGGLWVRVQAAEAFLRGQTACGTRAFTHTGADNLTGAINTRLLTTTVAGYTVRVTNRDGQPTTFESPRRGSILHIQAGTGDQQFARVNDVLSTTQLGIDVITDPDLEWTTALDATSDAWIISEGLARLADTDDAGDGFFPPLGIAQAAITSGWFGWLKAKGRGVARVGSTVADMLLGIGATAGQLEAFYPFYSGQWDPGNLAADGNATTTSVTVTGAVLGDYAVASLTTNTTAGGMMTTQVTAANTVIVTLLNETGGAYNVAEGTLRVLVIPQNAHRTSPIAKSVSPPTTAGELGYVQIDCGHVEPGRELRL